MVNHAFVIVVGIYRNMDVQVLHRNWLVKEQWGQCNSLLKLKDEYYIVEVA